MCQEQLSSSRGVREDEDDDLKTFSVKGLKVKVRSAPKMAAQGRPDVTCVCCGDPRQGPGNCLACAQRDSNFHIQPVLKTSVSLSPLSLFPLTHTLSSEHSPPYTSLATNNRLQE